MYLPENASRIRQKEAQRARDNRAEIVRALSIGQITRRDLVRWGIFTGVGTLAAKHGLNPLVRSAYAQTATLTPRSPLGGATKFSQPMHRLEVLAPTPLTRGPEGNARFPAGSPERDAKRLSWHTDFNADPSNPDLRNPLTSRGPIEGRPPGEIFAHQRWDEFFPKVAYVLSMGQCASGTYFHDRMASQQPNKVWTFGKGRNGYGEMPPPLIKARYGEPILTRIYNNLPRDRAENGGFGRNEITTHFHNAHNGAESDGAANVHHFPGTFYDYRWSTTLARRDKINTQAADPRASGPDGNGGLVNVPGDFREIQSSMWFHDHRFFFTAENVYKGNLGVINMYSGPDRGNEVLDDGVNLRLPSGSLLDYGNLDFDVNLVVSDGACDQAGQYFFDIFNSDGFLGDLPLVNFAYAPYFEVLPRRYRFRILNACMSRFLKLGLFNSLGRAVPMIVIANDGNLLPNPVSMSTLDVQGNAERFDVIVDFSRFRVGERLHLANLLEMRSDGRGPQAELSYTDALKRAANDPVLGQIMQFRVVGSVASVDVPGVTHRAGTLDRSRVPAVLTETIPIVTPVRTRVVEFGRSGSGESTCVPDCGEKTSFPWTIRINGESAHSLNANRVSLLIPKQGEVEHWTYVNAGGGWDHPIHLHFEEGVTMDRGGGFMAASEQRARKDVWRLRENGRVTFQVQFGEFAGAYVNHCHNTVHEDWAMIMRYQILGEAGTPHAAVTPTPNPTEDGVFFTTPEILPEGDPRRSGG
jgi:FtsP/CotA-like multicopper oxidase with cupredoxin domain